MREGGRSGDEGISNVDLPGVIDRILNHLRHTARGAADDRSWARGRSILAPRMTDLVPRMIDAKSDVYSLGVTAFLALTGRVPSAGIPELERRFCSRGCYMQRACLGRCRV